jgi:hypothetical protein
VRALALAGVVQAVVELAGSGLVLVWEEGEQAWSRLLQCRTPQTRQE